MDNPAEISPETEAAPVVDPMEQAASTFDKHVGIEAKPEDKPVTDKPVVEAAKPDVPKSDIPDEILLGTKPEEKPDPAAEFDKLVAEVPKGQLRHEQFKLVQEGAKKEVERHRAELATLKAELEKNAGKTIPDDVASELKTLRERLAERDSILEKVAYEQTEAFQKNFTSKEKNILEKVTRIGEEYESQKTVKSLLKMTERDRDEALQNMDLPEGAKLRLAAHLVNLDQLASEKEAELSKSRENLNQYNAEQKQQAEAREAQQREQEDRLFEKELSEATTKLPAFRKIDGNEAWNKEVEERTRQAKDFFNGKASMQEVAQVCLRGIAAVVQDKIIDNQKARIQQLSDEITKLKSASPGGGNAPGYKPDDANLSPEERAMSTFDRLVGAAKQGGF